MAQVLARLIVRHVVQRCVGVPGIPGFTARIHTTYLSPACQDVACRSALCLQTQHGMQAEQGFTFAHIDESSGKSRTWLPPTYKLHDSHCAVGAPVLARAAAAFVAAAAALAVAAPRLGAIIGTGATGAGGPGAPPARIPVRAALCAQNWKRTRGR